MTTSRFIKTLLTLALFASPAAAKPAALPRLHADPARVSVSGLSSGGFMAVQYDVAFSSEVMGIGVVAGGPYNCAFVNAGGIETCLAGMPVGAASYAAATGFAALGEIDAPSNLAAGKVYLFSGTDDSTVHQPVMNAVRDFYKAAGVPDGNLTYVNDVPAGHAFLSPDFGGACATTAAPYVNECTVGGTLYDQPGAILALRHAAAARRGAGREAGGVRPIDLCRQHRRHGGDRLCLYSAGLQGEQRARLRRACRVPWLRAGRRRGQGRHLWPDRL